MNFWHLLVKVPGAEAEGAATTEYMLLGGTVIGLAIIFFVTRKLYAADAFNGVYEGFRKVLANKWYVDEIYEAIIVKPVRWIGKKVVLFTENEVIDWIVNGVGKGVQLASRQLRLVQSRTSRKLCVVDGDQHPGFLCRSVLIQEVI